jgi:hypothetical protein
MSIDSFKSPLRRKLRVFKKRKFTSSKESGKSSKRVSWSSDDNNDESYTDKERLTIDKQNKNQVTNAVFFMWLKMMFTPVHMRELCLRFELLYL